MALLLKNNHRPAASSIQPVVIDQWIKVIQQSATPGTGVNLPISTTGRLFRVKGGKVRIRALIATVTTIVQTQTCNLKVSAQKLTTGSATVGTAVDIASNLDITALEAGGHLFVEGDGTAVVKSTAGAVLVGTNTGYWIAEPGQIYVTTDATNTGKLIYELWYQPLDAGAFVEPEVLAAGLLQAKI